MLPSGYRFVDGLRNVVMHLRQKSSSPERNLDVDDETTSCTTPSPTTSFSEASTSSRRAIRGCGLATEGTGSITPPVTTSASSSQPPSGNRRKSGIFFAKLYKTISIDMPSTSAASASANFNSEEGGTLTPASDNLSRNNSEKQLRSKKSTTTNARKASRAMRRRISAARLALRKISHSNRANSGSGLDISTTGCRSEPFSFSSADEASPPIMKASEEPAKFWFLRSPGAILKRSTPPSKRKLCPSLSWDPEHRSRSPSTSSRTRLHSDGGTEPPLPTASTSTAATTSTKHEPLPAPLLGGSNKIDDDPNGDRLELTATCLHCSLSVEYKHNVLRYEIENAVKRLARRLGNRPSISWPRAADEHTTSVTSSGSSNGSHGNGNNNNNNNYNINSTGSTTNNQSRNMGTPDIVVSSISSDEETDPGLGRQTSSERNSSFCTSDASISTNSPSPITHPPGSTVFFSTEAGTGTPTINYDDGLPTDNDTELDDDMTVRLFGERRKRRGAVTEFPGIAAAILATNPPKDITGVSSVISPVTGEKLLAAGKQQQQQQPGMDTLKLPGATSSVDGTSATDSSNSPPRSNSVDLSTLRRDIELWSISSGDISEIGSDNEIEPATPAESIRTIRSRSHDPSQSPDHILRRPSRIEHLSEIFRKALAKSPVVKRTAGMQEHDAPRVSKHRTSRYWLDDQLNASEHIWLPSSGPGSTSTATDTECYLGEKDCERVGEKHRCAACHIVAHTSCFPLLAKMNLTCKTTYRDSTVKRSPSKDSWDALTKHHWVHRWKLEGRCQQCAKSFQQKMFRDKEVIAITCSWCKASYHNKRSCFSLDRFEEKCGRGVLRDMILPPSWLLRLPNTRKRHGKHAVANGDRKAKPAKRKYRPFIVKPGDPSMIGPSQPLLVFVNPKSGGNKGSKALHTLCWLLNPRQVFDITTFKGPRYGLEMFRKVGPQLRVLVCGGDGTVGWVLSTLDQLNWPAYPPIALMPLGTGNDLSRCMGWGGVFSDEPLAELLNAVLYETSVTHLDRWRVDVQPNTNIPPDFVQDELNEAVQSSLPLTVMNNYFSIGADAHVALQFHHSRSANPSMLNSRFKNRIAYGGLGTIDLFKRTWKDLSEFIMIEADGVDITHKIREFKFHCVLFHNITFYAGGTIPWGNDQCEKYGKPSSCDGKIEILGFTTATLASLQMGGRGERIAQCSRIKITTLKAIPMQVDGEPCLLAPSIISLSFHSKVPMLKRDKKLLTTPAIVRKTAKDRAGQDAPVSNTTAVIMHVPVIVVGRHDYDTFRDSLDRLKDTAFEVGTISLESETELTQTRQLVQKMLCDHQMLPYEPGRDWRFLDYISNAEEGTFILSRHQEHNHTVSDIANMDECVIILDDAFPSMTARSAAIGSDLIFTPAVKRLPNQNPTSQRRISETLRIVLSSESQETHL